MINLFTTLFIIFISLLRKKEREKEEKRINKKDMHICAPSR